MKVQSLYFKQILSRLINTQPHEGDDITMFVHDGNMNQLWYQVLPDNLLLVYLLDIGGEE